MAATQQLPDEPRRRRERAEPIVERDPRARSAGAARRVAGASSSAAATRGRRRRPAPVRGRRWRAPGCRVIAEHKRRSPSAGVIREELPLEDVVGAYERGGAAALSVLTEEASFGGSLADLRRGARRRRRCRSCARTSSSTTTRSYESLAAGADAILLIVAALRRGRLARAACAGAASSGWAVLVEVHDERELEVAAESERAVIGINNRDLTTLAVDTARTFELLPRIPAGQR